MTNVKRSKKKLKSSKLEAELPPVTDTIPQGKGHELSRQEMDARDVSMFKAWFLGKTYEDIAVEYNLSAQQVWRIADQYKWKAMRQELKARQFAEAMSEIRDLAVFVQNALGADIRNLVSEALAQKKQFTKEERDHLRHMHDRLLKEVRLDEGKPTEINTGPVQVEIVLPAGAKRFGVIPPDPKMKVVEATTVEAPKLDVDSLENELKGKK